MIKKLSEGFTLIEILIVVAIIAILASVVLVGLGPTQQAGRDARRISDLSEVQNSLELYYNKCGIYPGSESCVVGAAGSGATWSDLSGVITGADIGIVAALPNDPSQGASYNYWYGAGNTSYVLGAHLENSANAVFSSYTAPVLVGVHGLTGVSSPKNCSDTGNYCKTL